jgi:hypothetical protein
MRFAPTVFMAVTQHIGQYARGRMIRRASRSMPWIGALIALFAVGSAMRRKGAIGGAVDTALDVMPGVGAMKNAVEAFRGRDFIKDKNVAR